jgi:hypothetical protein
VTTTTETPSLKDFLAEWSTTLLSMPGSYYEGANFAPLGGPAPDITPESIAAVDLYYLSDDHASWAEQDVAAVVRLRDGNWAAVTGWCDSSGWGCQQGVEWRVTATREDAIKYGLDKSARIALGVGLPEETP